MIPKVLELSSIVKEMLAPVSFALTLPTVANKDVSSETKKVKEPPLLNVGACVITGVIVRNMVQVAFTLELLVSAASIFSS